MKNDFTDKMCAMYGSEEPISDAYADFLERLLYEACGPHIAMYLMSYYNQAGPWSDMLTNHLNPMALSPFDITWTRHPILIDPMPVTIKGADELLEDHKKESVALWTQ